MTDQGRSLSRRERRAAEVRSATPEEPTTPIPELVAGPPTHADGTPLTRKERRELERADSPLETWTVEEELIATGQLPAMTPELLDQQEMVQRRRAAEPVEPEPVVDEAVEPEPEPEPEPVVDEVVEPEPEPVVDEAVEPEHVVDEAADEPEIEPQRPVLTSPWAEFAAASAPAEPADEAPDAADHAVQDAEPDVEPAAEHPFAPVDTYVEPTPTGAIDAIPEEYRHLFPPGSLQARRLEERSQGVPSTGAEADEPTNEDAHAADQDVDARTPVAEDPAAEIRRLTAEAMAGITRAQQVRMAPTAEVSTDPEAEMPDAAAPADSVDEAEPTAESEPTAEADFWGAVAYGAGHADSEEDSEPLSPAEVYAQAEQDIVGQLGETVPAPDADLVDSEPDVAEPVVAEVAAGGVAASTTAEPEAIAPHPEAAIVPAGLRPVAPAAAAATVWDSHPLTQAQPREVADYAPSDDIPIPDFTKIMHGYASTASSAGTAPAGEVGDAPTGTHVPAADVVRRPLPEDSEEGAHHFAWAHLAVIGAVAFLLGVLVWHLTGNAG